MEHYGHGDIIIMDHQDKMKVVVLVIINNHQFKYLVLITLQITGNQEHNFILKLMEHYGGLGIIIEDNQHKIILMMGIHHQFKYQVLIGSMYMVLGHLRLMDHYGSGDKMMLDKQEITVMYGSHHQFKYLELGIYLMCLGTVILKVHLKTHK